MLTNKNSTKLPAVKVPGAGNSLQQQNTDPYEHFMTPQKIPVRHQLLS